jgi:type I restriction enzyme S subunit
MSWQNVKIDTLKANARYSLVGGPFGSDLTTRDYVEDGVPVVRGTNLSDDREFVDEGFVYVREEKADALKSNIAYSGDLVFTQRGTLGQVGIIPEKPRYSRYVISQSQMKLTVDPKRVCSRYVYYYFRHPETIQKVKNQTLTSGVPHINLGILKTFEIPLPPLPVQVGIVKVLSTYDDLIENNRRRMALLEDAARQVYQEWFVSLRFPGYEHTRIVEGVPEGWKKGIVSDFYETSSGGTPSRKRPEYFTGDIPWIKTQELHDGFIIDTDEKITEAALNNSSAKLFADKTILVALYGATIGKIGILAVPATTNQACCAIIPKDKRSHYIHAFLFFRENKERLVSLSAGAAQNNISQRIIRGFEMIVPNPSLMKSFTGSLEPVFEQWLNLHRQNQKLRTARDLLLPKLMSGEITV